MCSVYPFNLKDKNEEVGSPLFMAPELFEEKGKISGKCDIWATGILLYEMLTKKLPYHGESIHELRVAVQHDVPEHPKLSAQVFDLI